MNQCNMQPSNSRILAVLLGYLVAQAKAYPMQGWPVYPQTAREYQDDDYYYAPKVQYYYDAPAAIPANMPDAYGQVAYPYYYDPYGHIANNDPKMQEERYSALPIGQETWFESESSPRWRGNDVDDDVSATFLDNLILTQMAQDAQRRRENTRAAFPPVDYEERNAEDEDVRELKALAGKPFYHVPKTVPKIEDDDYASDDSFINWNGNKRSVTTAVPITATTVPPRPGQVEEVMAGPARATTSRGHHERQNKMSSAFYDTIAELISNKPKSTHSQESTKARRIDKRFVAGDSDLVMQLRGLKHRIRT